MEEKEVKMKQSKKPFGGEAKVYPMRKIYPGSPDKVDFIIVTSRSEGYLKDKYGNEIDSYIPYIIIMPWVWKVMEGNDRYVKRKEDRKRAFTMPLDIYSYDFLSSEEEVSEPYAYLVKKEKKKRKDQIIDKFDSILPEAARRRLYKYYLDGKSMKEIAEEENCSVQTVSESIISGKIKIQKYYAKLEHEKKGKEKDGKKNR